MSPSIFYSKKTEIRQEHDATENVQVTVADSKVFYSLSLCCLNVFSQNCHSVFLLVHSSLYCDFFNLGQFGGFK